MISMTVNGERHKIDAAPEMPLLWALRDHLGLLGSKYGCGQGLCGACTVLVDGEALRSCQIPLGELGGRQVVTIQGLERVSGRLGIVGRALMAAWVDLDVIQCGYCQPGQVLTATALLRANPAPADADIIAAMDGNICRCGTYQRIRAAIRLAAQRLAGAK